MSYEKPFDSDWVSPADVAAVTRPNIIKGADAGNIMAFGYITLLLPVKHHIPLSLLIESTL